MVNYSRKTRVQYVHGDKENVSYGRGHSNREYTNVFTMCWSGGGVADGHALRERFACVVRAISEH